MKGLLPIILIIVAFGLFFLQVNPLYSEVKQLKTEEKQYDEALEIAKQLKDLRVELAQKLESFPEQDMQKLDHFLPRRLDTVRIVLDIDGIAARHNVRLEKLNVTEPTPQKGKATTATPAYTTVGVSFAFTSSYANASQFVRDLQQSLRLFDIVNVNVQPSETLAGQYQFSIGLNTYWINR